MEEYNKEIKIDDNKSIRYEINKGYVPVHTITSIDKDSINKIIRFSRWDDYNFCSWTELEFEEYINNKQETHIFDKKHPLYIPLLHLLDGEKELIIDDDETPEVNKKYMEIVNKNDYINIIFNNYLENDLGIERFNVFIKNIGFDIRSKIDCNDLDTKERLFFFFEEVFNLFKEEYHQVSIEEHLLNNNDLSLEESKKFVKKFINK